MSDKVIHLPGKEPVMEKTPTQVAHERLYFVEKAIQELSELSPDTLAGMMFERIDDGKLVGTNWYLRRCMNMLSGLEGRIEVIQRNEKQKTVLENPRRKPVYQDVE